MYDIAQKNILDNLERLLLIALRKGEMLRFPKRYEGAVNDIGSEVGYACRELDNLGCSWAIQNEALCYINDADTPKVWQALHRKPLRVIAQEIVADYES